MQFKILIAFLSLLILSTSCNQITAVFQNIETGEVPQDAEEVFVESPEGVRVEVWQQGLEIPWSLVFLPNGDALVSERPGRIRIIRNGQLQQQPY